MDGDKDDIEKFIAVHGVTKASPAKARGAESQSEWALRRKGFRSYPVPLSRGGQIRILGKDVKRRALAEVETAGLIHVERLVGRTARVTLV